MLGLFLTRCFLLLLLVCDWAGDPYHGHSPLSQPQSSQVYCCQSICSAALDRFAGLDAFLMGIPASDVHFPLMDCMRLDAEQFPTYGLAIDILYVFMSLNR